MSLHLEALAGLSKTSVYRWDTRDILMSKDLLEHEPYETSEKVKLHERQYQRARGKMARWPFNVIHSALNRWEDWIWEKRHPLPSETEIKMFNADYRTLVEQSYPNFSVINRSGLFKRIIASFALVKFYGRGGK